MSTRLGASVLLVSVAFSSVAMAQPGAQPYPPPQPDPYAPQPGYPPPQPGYPPPPQQYPTPQPYPPAQGYAVPPPQQYAVQLTEEERELLFKGEIDDGKMILGGLGAVFFGFGVGQAIEGRWSDTGWIFTLGEIGALALIIGGAVDAANDCIGDFDDNCENDPDDGVGWIIAGALGFTGLRIWESVDAFVGPGSHNRRVREIRARAGYGYPQPYYGISPYVAPTSNGGGTAGLTLSF